MAVFDKKRLEDKLKTLQSDYTEEQNNSVILSRRESLFIKSLILIPSILVIIGLYFVNAPKQLLSILAFVIFSLSLVFIGVLIYSLMMSNKIK
tara:strand:- start:509 stop:787 length:279 start_codon:yes stop_codon:yes gene_type:complete